MNSQSLRASLMALARNHHWDWTPSARAVLDDLPGSSTGRHPVQVVSSLDEAQLDALCDDGGFLDRVRRRTDHLDDLLADTPPTPEIAYFSPEFGISDLVPQYSGGLGVLAGDHLKSASDLGLSLGAVGLFYHRGFFRQEVVDGEQTEHLDTYAPADLGFVDTGVEVPVPIGDHDVTARAWRLDVGRIPLLVLTTDLPANDVTDRAITDRLYSGDRRHRIQQEIVLGVGGVRVIRKLGWTPAVHHLNEGHAGFLILELLDDHLTDGRSLASALDAIRPGLVFTTHTPVPAGIERFDTDLAGEHLEPFARRWGLDPEELVDLGTTPDDRDSFNLATFCLRASARANGVSKLHGEVSRSLFADVPGGPAITSVTNGVHARTWVAPRLQDTFDEHLGGGWADGDRQYITGGSGGGILTAWVVGKTGRFKAAVAQKPVINWHSFIGVTDAYPGISRYWFHHMPWEEPQQYLDRSPISLVGNVTTPTMLLTGEDDHRTPISESEQFYQALRLRGIDTM
ncbi:MAG: alpha-glucan family phosphorylase, partial [Acidimicrobiales bacterium]